MGLDITYISDKGGNLTNKFLHVVQNTNYAFPYKDWDAGKHSIVEYKKKYWTVCREMACTLASNIVFSLVMMVPLWYTGQKLSTSIHIHG